jgi:predicted Zn-dependent peptidase
MYRPGFVVVAALLLSGACTSSSDTVAPAASGDAAAVAANPGEMRVAGDPMGVVVKKLPNGFTLMVSENHETPRAECWITTRAGSAKDPADATGLAHYLEHMNFKGTTRLGTLNWEAEKKHLDRINELYDERFATADEAKRAELYKQIDAENVEASKYEVANEFDSLYSGLGFNGLNAFTSNDQTSYTVDIPVNRLETWAAVEAERFTSPVYRLFQTELEAVYEEKNRGMDNKARAQHEAVMLALWPDHPYGTQDTLGKVEHLKNPSLNKITDFYKKWYVPGNMVIAVSGDFNASEALAILEKHFGSFPAKPVPPDPVRNVAPLKGVTRVELKFEAEEVVNLAWRTVPATHPEAEAVTMADMMLANGNTGLIDVNVEQKQLMLNAGAFRNSLAEDGYELLSGTAKKGQTLEECEKLLLEQLELLKKGHFTEEDMKAALTDFEISKKRQLESNRARVADMTDAFVNAQPWSWKVAEMDRLRAVTKDQIVAAANKYFGGDYVVVYRRTGKPELPKIQKPGFTPVKIQTEKHSPWYEEMAKFPAPPIEPRFVEAGRDFVAKDMQSGRLVAGKNPANDLFQLSFSIETGSDDDPRLQLATALLEFGGAGDMDAAAFKRKLYSLGTTISAGSGRQESSITMTGVDANFEASLDLLRAHFATPTGASQADLDKLVERIVSSREKQKIDARAMNGALASYAQRGEDSDFLRSPKNEELRAMKAEDLLAGARDLWRFKRTALYVGVRSADDVAKLVDLPPIGAGFDAMVAPATRRAIVPVVPAKPRVLFLHKSPAAQAQVTLIYPDGLYDRPAVPTHRVYNEYMSGSMGAVVFQEIRESRALAYDAGTVYRDASWKEDGNVFLGVLGTQADKTLDAIEVLMRIVKEMPASETRMANAKQSIDETYRTTRIGFRTIPGVVMSWWRQGLDGDPRPWNWQQVKKLTLADLSAFAARWKDKPYTIAITGDRAKFDMEKLAQYGEVREMKVDELFAW